MADLLAHYRQLVGIAKGWAVKHLPGWCDDCHRDLLKKHGAAAIEGRYSAGSMTLPQLAAVLSDYEGRGWPRQRKYAPPVGQSVKPQAIPKDIRLMVQLWGRLGQSGKIDHATRPALLKFCARQTAQNVPNLDALSVDQRQAIIEALKAMLRR